MAKDKQAKYFGNNDKSLMTQENRKMMKKILTKSKRNISKKEIKNQS